jgi:hypothetical protein
MGFASDHGSGQVVTPGHGSGQVVTPGHGSGQVATPDHGSGQLITARDFQTSGMDLQTSLSPEATTSNKETSTTANHPMSVSPIYSASQLQSMVEKWWLWLQD